MATRSTWTAKGLRGRCEEFRASLLRRRTATAEEIADYWPGGKVNTEPDPLGKWIFCYGNLVGFLRRRDPAEEDRKANAALDLALANAPVMVTCSDGSTRAVYPKSFHALRFLDVLDRSVNDLVSAVAEYGGDPEALKALMVFPVLESTAVRLWAWILTSEGPTLPFDEHATPESPAWTKALAPEDILAIAKAHIEVNATRLKIISEAFPADGAHGSRLSLSGFLGTASQEMGVQPSRLLREWSLGEVFAQSISAAQAHREAIERSKAG